MKHLCRQTLCWGILIFLLMSSVSGCLSQNRKQGTNSSSQPGSGAPDTESSNANPSPPAEPADPIIEKLSRMSTAEKVGQLVLVGLEGTEINDQMKELIDTYHVGGFIFYKTNIQSSTQALRLFNGLKKENSSNPVPLFLSVDEEGGRISRLPKEFVRLPSNQRIGEVNETELSRKIGRILGQELYSFGLNMDFAPVLDINSNPDNPVIGDRSFGDRAEPVSRLGVATMKGIKDRKVIPVVKHFPGHGDTSVDSHIGLPVVEHGIDRLRQLELVPFKEAIAQQADVVMIAHLLMPKLDPDHPASFSKAVITDLLRKELGFQGVVISDDMTMGAIEKNYKIGSAAVQAVLAGGNIVLVGHDYDKEVVAIRALTDAVNDGTISDEVLNDRVYAILKLKENYGLKDAPAEGPDIKSINTSIRSLLNSYQLSK